MRIYLGMCGWCIFEMGCHDVICKRRLLVGFEMSDYDAEVQGTGGVACRGIRGVPKTQPSQLMAFRRKRILAVSLSQPRIGISITRIILRRSLQSVL